MHQTRHDGAYLLKITGRRTVNENSVFSRSLSVDWVGYWEGYDILVKNLPLKLTQLAYYVMIYDPRSQNTTSENNCTIVLIILPREATASST